MGEAMLQERLVQCQQDLEQAKVRKTMVQTLVKSKVKRADLMCRQVAAGAAMGEAMLQEWLVQCQRDLEQAKVRFNKVR